MKIGLVTDSTADIPSDLMEKYDIRVGPALVNIQNRSYRDGIDITREEYYTRLPKLNPPPTTSAPSVGDFQKPYEDLFKKGVSHIISIHAANALSGIFNGARLAAQDFGDCIHVLDSGQLTLGIGFQVLTAAESIARGALLEELERAAIDNFKIENSTSISDFVRLNDNWTRKLLPPEVAVTKMPRINLTPGETKNIINGIKIDNPNPRQFQKEGLIALFDQKRNLSAIGQVSKDSESIQPKKVLA